MKYSVKCADLRMRKWIASKRSWEMEGTIQRRMCSRTEPVFAAEKASVESVKITADHRMAGTQAVTRGGQMDLREKGPLASLKSEAGRGLPKESKVLIRESVSSFIVTEARENCWEEMSVVCDSRLRVGGFEEGGCPTRRICVWGFCFDASDCRRFNCASRYSIR